MVIMPHTPELRCFVASAILPRSDVDRLYRRQVKPALRSLGVQVFRIDEIEHNENIDIRILEEIGKADFILADLTFSRPSVYFEAGYGFGLGRPVVYTSRLDHLSAHARDDYLRVHFDLRQRNIIGWSNESDRTFQKRLLARIRKTVAPLLRLQLKQVSAQKAEREFASVSVAERRRKVLEAAIRQARAARFQQEGRIRGRRMRPADVPAGAGWLGYKPWRRFAKTLFVVANSSLSVRNLRTLRDLEPTMAAALPVELRRRFRIHHCALLSLAPLSSQRLESALPDFYPLGTRPGRWWCLARPDHVLYVHVIDGIRSVEALTATFRGLLKTIGRGS